MPTTHDHPVPEQLTAAHAPLADEAIGAALAGCIPCQSAALSTLSRGAHAVQVVALVVTGASASCQLLAMATGKGGQDVVDLWRSTANFRGSIDAETLAVVDTLTLSPSSDPAREPAVWGTDEAKAVLEAMGSAGRSQVASDALTWVAGAANLIGL